MLHMKTASVRELRQNFPRILAWIQAGDEVAITLRRQAVARLVPCRPKKAKKKPWPDIQARLKKVFKGKVIPHKEMEALMDENRGVF